MAEINYLYFKNLLWEEMHTCTLNKEKIATLKIEIGYIKDILLNFNDPIYLTLLLEEIEKDNIIIAKSIINQLYIKQSYEAKRLTDTKEYKICKSKLDNYKKRYEELLKNKLAALNVLSDTLMSDSDFKIAKEILACLKHTQFINSNNVKFLWTFFDKKNLPETTKLLLMELVLANNSKYNKNVDPHNRLYSSSIPNLIKHGYEMLTTNHLDYDDTIEKSKKIIIDNFHYCVNSHGNNLDDFIEYLNNLKLNDSQMQIILIELINDIYNKIYDQKDLISTREFYCDQEIKKEISSYFIYLEFSLIKFQNMYNQLLEKGKEKTDLISQKNRIIFISKEKVFSDLKDFPEEYLTKVDDLLSRFITGELLTSEIESFNERFKGFKLKHDQIRIVIEQVKDNIYCVKGMGVKKDQKGNLLYGRLCTRNIPENIEESLINAEQILNEMKEFIKNKARKGTR